VDPAAPEPDRGEIAVALLERHGSSFRRTARRVSICAADADDALQRAVEILLTKAPTDDHRRLVGWMNVVTRHEAIALRRGRERALGWADGEPDELLDSLPVDRLDPADLAERREGFDADRRALASLKADHRRAIFLQALGYSYAEIAALCGWTYTKVNRCLAEGRDRLRASPVPGSPVRPRSEPVLPDRVSPRPRSRPRPSR
jgi:RNA polymerase sigma factor (sigma-70 family)